MTVYYVHFQFVCRVLSIKWTPTELEDLHRFIQTGDIIWEAVVEIVNEYVVAPAFWVGLMAKGLEKTIPQSAVRYFSQIHHLNQVRNQHLRRQLLEALDAIQQAGVPTLLLKGAGQLVQPLHGDMGFRIIGDLDLLIDPQQYNIAVDALDELGYASQPVPYDTDHLHHYAPLHRPGDYGVIELHRHAVHARARPVLPTEKVWADAVRQSVGGLHLILPSATHALMINFLHSQVADSNHGQRQFNLRSLLDFGAMLTKDKSGSLAWPAMHQAFTSFHMAPIWRAYALAARRLLNAPAADALQAGPSARLHHMACLAAVRWLWADALVRRLFEFSGERIGHRYGRGTENALALSAYRSLYLIHYLREHLRHFAV